MMEVRMMTPRQWESLSEDAFKVVFGEWRPSSKDRIDYALIAEHASHGIFGYVTCRDHDEDTVYWQFGGAFPNAAKKKLAVDGYRAFIRWTMERYDRIYTFIENNNVTMLKLAMHHGFKVVGVRNYEGKILLEHVLDFKKES